MKTRKTPMRKCTGCQEMKSKKELIRVVRNDEGEISLDRTGKKNGRGAYVCPNITCLERAVKSKGLERAFKMRVPNELYDILREELKTDG